MTSEWLGTFPSKRQTYVLPCCILVWRSPVRLRSIAPWACRSFEEMQSEHVQRAQEVVKQLRAEPFGRSMVFPWSFHGLSSFFQGLSQHFMIITVVHSSLSHLKSLLSFGFLQFWWGCQTALRSIAQEHECLESLEELAQDWLPSGNSFK